MRQRIRNFEDALGFTARDFHPLLAAALSGCLLLSVAALSCADTDAALDRLFGTHAPYHEFLIGLKKDVGAQNWSAVAGKVAYPITVKIAGHRRRLDSRAQFIRHAALIMTPNIVRAIEQQQYESLFANGNGVMIGSGEVWFSGICPDTHCTDPPIKIIAINP